MKLTELKSNVPAVATNISKLPVKIRNQLIVLGLLPNTILTVMRVSPFGGVLQLQLRDSFIAINCKIAELIDVEIVNNEINKDITQKVTK